MIETGRVGLYGKLPAHGDFVSRSLNVDFIQYWDEWLQRCIAVSQEQLGERWLDYYLVSPIWRFVLSPGVVDNVSWAGILVPSVDSVGRYFPFTVAMPLVKVTSLLDVFVKEDDWFRQVEENALAALHDNLSVEVLHGKLMKCLLQETGGSRYDYRLTCETNSGDGKSSNSKAFSALGGSQQIDLESPEQNPLSVYPMMYEQLVRQLYPSYSAWWSQGSEFLDPSFNLVRHLPDAGLFSAYLDGRWSGSAWEKPYQLNRADKN